MRSKASKKPTVTNQDNKSRPSKAEVPSHNVTKSQLKSENKDDEHKYNINMPLYQDFINAQGNKFRDFITNYNAKRNLPFSK